MCVSASEDHIFLHTRCSVDCSHSQLVVVCGYRSTRRLIAANVSFNRCYCVGRRSIASESGHGIDLGDRRRSQRLGSHHLALLCFRIRRSKRVATWLLSRGSTKFKLTKEDRVKIAKISESMWKLTYYVTVEACILATIFPEPWFADMKGYYSGWPNQELKLPLKLFYMCQCGFYTYSIVALLTWETRRKDFSVMMAHHIVTVTLISVSYVTRFFRVGSVILALHDASDVFLEVAKVFKYSGKETGASIFFGLFAVSWAGLRLIIFPFWVIRSVSCYSPEVLILSDTFYATLYYVFNTFLLTLFVFHVYWWYLICAMITKQLKNRGKVGEDIRSDSEDDE